MGLQDEDVEEAVRAIRHHGCRANLAQGFGCNLQGSMDREADAVGREESIGGAEKCQGQALVDGGECESSASERKGGDKAQKKLSGDNVGGRVVSRNGRNLEAQAQRLHGQEVVVAVLVQGLDGIHLQAGKYLTRQCQCRRKV